MVKVFGSSPGFFSSRKSHSKIETVDSPAAQEQAPAPAAEAAVSEADTATAAMKIQAIKRGKNVRIEQRQKSAAAARIQALHKGRSTRQVIKAKAAKPDLFAKVAELLAPMVAQFEAYTGLKCIQCAFAQHLRTSPSKPPQFKGMSIELFKKLKELFGQMDQARALPLCAPNSRHVTKQVPRVSLQTDPISHAPEWGRLARAARSRRLLGQELCKGERQRHVQRGDARPSLPPHHS